MKTLVTRSAKKSVAAYETAQSYAALREAVRQAIVRGKERAFAAVEYEKVRTCWEIGKLILQHVLINEYRADYGQATVAKLAADLNLSRTDMMYMLEFAREYPIVPAPGQLTWSHYRELLAVNQIEARQRLADATIQHQWSSRHLRSEIKKMKAEDDASKKKAVPLSADRGALDVYRTREISGKILIDLGFSTYVQKSSREIKAAKLKFVKDRMFTYRAEVEKIVDGDTLWCVIDLGLGIKTRQKLRLAKINAPELDTYRNLDRSDLEPERGLDTYRNLDRSDPKPAKGPNTGAGVKAKRYLSRKLPKGSTVIIATTKSDKYDRYLADVFKDEEYINQTLVEKGYARPV